MTNQLTFLKPLSRKAGLIICFCWLLGLVIPDVSLHGQTIAPVAYWQFEQNNPDFDHSGNGHHLAGTSAINLQSNPELVGTHYDVDDSLQPPSATYVPFTVDDSAGMRTQMSIEFWFRAKKNFHEGQIRWNNKALFAIKDCRLIFYVLVDGGLRMDLEVPFNGIGVLDLNHTMNGAWHHFVLQYSAKTGEQRIWIDGISSPEMVIYHGTSSLIRDGGNMLLSTPASSGAGVMFGSYDEFALYDTLIPRELIRLHYTEALQLNQHYSFLVPPTDPADFPLPSSDSQIDTLEFGNGYPNVPYLTQELLKSYPLPRYQPGHNMPPLVPWLVDAENNSTFGHGANFYEKGLRMQQSLELLARDYHYYLYAGVIRDAIELGLAGSLNSNQSHWHFLEMMNNPALSDLPRFAVSNRRTNEPSWVDSTLTSTAYCVYTNFPDSHYVRNAAGVPISIPGLAKVITPAMANPLLPPGDNRLDSVRYEGLAIKTALDTIFGRLDPQNRWISMLGENDEATFMLGFGSIGQDAGCTADYNASMAPTQGPWGNTQGLRAYQSARFDSIRKIIIREYRDPVNILNQAAGRDSLQVLWFDSGGESFHYDSIRTAMPPFAGIRRPTPYFYPQKPSRVLKGVNANKGFAQIVRAAKIQQQGGDSLFTPAISPGYNDGSESLFDTAMVRPGQYLGALKAIGLLGADSYAFFMYHGNAIPTQNNWRMWKLVIPAYAQAISSRAEEFWYHGQVLKGDTAGSSGQADYTFFTFNTANPLDMIVARQEYGLNRFLITGSVQRTTNSASAGAKKKDVCFGLRDAHDQTVFDALAMEIRMQGSTYLLEINPADTFFMQLDGWHEWTDPWRWCRDFVFEAELNDSVFGNWSRGTERINPEFPGDFREFTSWVRLDAPGAGGIFNFEPRYDPLVNPSNDTMSCWVRARSLSGAGSVQVEVDGGQTQLISGIGAAWDWYETASPLIGLDSNAHALAVSAVTAGVDIDKIALKRSLADWTQQTVFADIELDSVHNGQPICYGDPVIFDNLSSLGRDCIQHSWDFGDGTQSFVTEPQHLYQYPGTFQVVYTMYDPCQDSTWSDSISVTVSAPIVDAGQDIQSCTGDTIFLKGTAFVPFSWAADPTLTNQLDLNTSVFPTQTGVYYYLTGTDTLSGCSMTDSVRVNFVVQNPIPDTLCIMAGDSVVLQPFGVGPGLVWTAPAAVAGDTNVNITVAPLVSTIYTYDTWDLCLCDTVSGYVQVEALGNNTITPINPVVCQGDTLTLTGNLSIPDDHTWSGPSIVGSNILPTVTVAPDTTEDYILFLNASAGCQVRDTVTVNVILQPDPIQSADSLLICQGDTLQLLANGPGTYSWNPPGSVSPLVGTDPFVFPASDSWIYLTNTVNYSPGFCSWSDSVWVAIDSNCCTAPGSVDYMLIGETASNFSSTIAGCSNCSGLSLYIRDTFVVDSFLQLNSCTLYMDSSAAIVIQSGNTLILDSCVVEAACGQMWDGITINGGGARMVMQDNSVLRDAVVGVLSLDNGEFRITDSHLLNNLGGLEVIGNGTPHSGVIFGCEISSDNTTMLPPYAGQFAHNGIFIRDVGAIRIGKNDSTDRNFIHHLASGIISEESGVDVWAQDIGFISGQAVLQQYQDGIGKCLFATGTAGASPLVDYPIEIGGTGQRANYFHHSDAGVWIWDNCDVTARRNHFQQIGGLGLYLDRLFDDEVLIDENRFDSVRFAIDVFDCRDAAVVVKRNVIRESEVGIYSIMNTRSEMEIRNNDLRSSLAVAGEGIHISDMSTFGLGSGFTAIRNNKVRLFGIGILADAVDSLRIQGNDIYVEGSDPATGFGIGVSVGASDFARVINNDVYWDTQLTAFPDTSQDYMGIWMFMSDEATVSCNHTYNWFEHIRVQGPINRQHIFDNRINDGWDGGSVNLADVPQVGIYLINDAFIGAQGWLDPLTQSGVPAGNVWRRLDLNGGLLPGGWTCNNTVRSMAEVENTQLITSIDLMYVRNRLRQNPDLSGFCNGNGGAPTAIPTFALSSVLPLGSSCEELPQDGGGSDPSQQRVAASSLDPSVNSTPALFISEQNLLARMESDSAVCQGDSLMQHCHSSLLRGSHKVILDNELSALQLNSGTLATSLPNSLIETNHRDLQSCWQKVLRGEELLPADLGLIESIALQCPGEGGKAVFQARSLLIKLQPGRKFIYSNCFPQPFSAKSELSTEPETSQGFSVFPNPGRNRVQVRAQQSGFLKISNQLGKTILDLEVENNLELDVSSWSRGIYHFQFRAVNGTLFYQKVVLQ